MYRVHENRQWYQICEITSKKFSKAKVEVHRSNLPPTVRWISHQIFLWTIWTKVKQSQRGGDDRCTNCSLHPERMAHLFFHCRASTNLYNQVKLHINSYLQEYASEELVNIDLDTALFHQTISGVHRNNIIHLLMVAKYTLYRLRFINPHCHTRPELTNSTDLNSASADQLGATKWHYNHLPVHPPTHAKL